MRRVSLAWAAIIGALLLAIPSAFAKTDLHRSGPGDHSPDDHDRRNVSAVRHGVELCADPGRDEGVLQLHQRQARSRQEARYRRPPDHLEVLRRRLQPGQLGAAAAQARRAGQGLRRRRHAGDRGQPGGAALPERAEGAARARLDRRQRVRQGTRQTRGRSAGSRTTSPRPGSTGSTSRRTIRTRRSRSSTRTTATGRTTCTASSRRSARRPPTS